MSKKNFIKQPRFDIVDVLTKDFDIPSEKDLRKEQWQKKKKV